MFVALIAVAVVYYIRYKMKHNHPSPVARSTTVAVIYKVTFKVVLTSYKYDETKWQNLFTFLGWGDCCLVPSENIFSDIMVKIRYLLMRLGCLFYTKLTPCVGLLWF